MTWEAKAFRPVSRSVIRVGCVRQRANAVPEEWLPRSGFGRGHTEPGLQASWRTTLAEACLCDCRRLLVGGRRLRQTFLAGRAAAGENGPALEYLAAGIALDVSRHSRLR